MFLQVQILIREQEVIGVEFRRQKLRPRQGRREKRIAGGDVRVIRQEWLRPKIVAELRKRVERINVNSTIIDHTVNEIRLGDQVIVVRTANNLRRRIGAFGGQG